jgi:regulator of protease activity HflC (stomatin/prohibitin superfamily)
MEDVIFALFLAIFGAFVLLAALVLLSGFFIVQPQTQVVVLRFGKYVRTQTKEGINWIFPIGRKLYTLSSQVVSIDLPRMMVLEANGNPIEVAAMIAYRIRFAQKAVLDVHDAGTLTTLLASAVVKNVCSQFPYAVDDPHAPCLRKESAVVTQALVSELQGLVEPAGIEILQVRLNDLAYAPEIAQSMLLRQQAAALVDARKTIVEGAVWTMMHAQKQMGERHMQLSPEAAQQFAENLMLVLCSGEKVQPVLSLASPGASVAVGGVR